MGRQIKSVSIPERLHERMKDIPNFSQWVIQALESEDGRTGAAIDRGAANRRRHIRDLEDIIEDFGSVSDDLEKVARAPQHHRLKAIRDLKEAVDGVVELWEETLAIRRKQA
jgi:hypothetical protein